MFYQIANKKKLVTVAAFKKDEKKLPENLLDKWKWSIQLIRMYEDVEVKETWSK